MDNPVFPYGPSPNKLEKLVASLVVRRKEQVTMDLLEQLGVPKTQLSIAFSGLKQLGFVNSDGTINALANKYANMQTRKRASEEILRMLYGVLTEIVENNPEIAQKAVNIYLQRLGRGDSAREKILKLFWHFWKNAEKGGLEDGLQIIEEKTYIGSIKSDEKIAYDVLRVSQEVIESKVVVDEAAITLAQSLIDFLDSRNKTLIKLKENISSLEQECGQLQGEIDRVQKMLDQHMLSYPSLSNINGNFQRVE